MYTVKPKKHLGQHFLKDENIANKIAQSLLNTNFAHDVIEIGPGTAVLTKYLQSSLIDKLTLIEIDEESVNYLKNVLAFPPEKIIHADFLKLELNLLFQKPLYIIGNFPYNISSQILFKVLDNKDMVTQVVGMFQREVARRISSNPGNKEYGILSVLLSAYYNIEYLFTVDEHVFSPPPKVKSGVIRLIKKNESPNINNDILFKNVVKTAFNQRRKTLRNSLKTFNISELDNIKKFHDKRPEQLSFDEFAEISNAIGLEKEV